MTGPNLMTEFNNLLNEYQTTYQQYIDTLDSSNNPLMLVDNVSFNSTKSISQTTQNTGQDCLNSCTDASNCTGGTYNPSSQNCALNSGIGSLINSPNYTAIAPSALYYSFKLQNINQQLINVNKQIMTQNNNMKTDYDNSYQSKQQSLQIIKNNNDILTNEQEEINLLIKENASIDKATVYSETNLTMHYYSYIIFMLLAILCIYLLIKFSIPTTQRGGGEKLFYPEVLFLFSIIFLSLCFKY